MDKCKVDFEFLPWQSPMNGIRFKAYQNEGQRLRVVEFTREFIEPDWCTKRHIGYVLEGQMDIDFSGDVVRFKAGDGLFIPAGQAYKHKAKVVSETVKLFLVEDA
jgi:ethanolamine utilization protein EutQ (cupin superfamily)